MTTGLPSAESREQPQNSPSLETAIKQIFGNNIEPNFAFRSESGTTTARVLGLIKEGTKENWETYANMNTYTGNKLINLLLDALYPYFNNPNYVGPEPGELIPDQQSLYDFVTSRLRQTTELIGVAAVIPDIQARVLGGIAGRGNTNLGISVTIEVETHDSKPKK